MHKKFLDFSISRSSEHLVLRRRNKDDYFVSSRCEAKLMTYISVFFNAVTTTLEIVGFIFHLNSIKTRKKCCHMFNAKKKKTFQNN